MTLFLLGVILSVPLAIGANLCTPWVRIWFDKRNSNRRKNRIAKIVQEAHQVTAFHDTPISMLAYSAFGIVTVIVNFALAIIFTVSFVVTYQTAPIYGLTLLFGILSIGSLTVAVNRASRFRSTLRRIARFDEYRESVGKQLSRLGGSIHDAWPEGQLGQGGRIESGSSS